MIITCPNCQTKYQVADQAIGAAGRKVMCANCHQAWKAVAPPQEARPKPKIVAGTDRFSEPESPAPAEPADPDRLFRNDAEAALDQAFADEEARSNSPPDPEEDLPPEPEDMAEDELDGDDLAAESDEDAGELDHHLQTRRRRDLAKRQKKHASRLPMARIRRVARMTSLIGLLTLVGLAYQFRIELVRTYPDLGGLYEMIGLPVNIYGLTFSDVETLRTLKDGDDVTIITAKIRSVVDRTVRVPPVLVSILNAGGEPIYEWTARAPVQNISPGDIVEFQTQLTSAPTDAAHVRLVFGASTAAEAAAP